MKYANEPTGNLIDIFQRINAAGTTIVMATHDRDIVNRLKKRVIEIEGGKIIRDQIRGRYSGR